MLLRADPRCFAVLLLLLCNRGDSVLVDELEAVAALWPNQELGDFEVLEQSGATCTVAAVDVDLQAANVQRVVDAGIATGATVLVLPELSTSADIPLMLRDRLEQFDDKVRLIVAGSYHHPAGEAWANTSLVHR